MKFGSNLFGNLREAYGNRHEPESVRILSDFYWHALLVVSFLILVLVFLFGTWVLLGALEELSSVQDTAAPPPPALDKTLLDATVRGIDTRKSTFNDLKTTNSTPIPDPSR